MLRNKASIDRRLLALLQADARESTASLARKLGVARTTIQERIARLQRDGTIAGYSVVLHRDPVDQYSEALVFLSAPHRKHKAVIEALRNLVEVRLCQSISGDYEILCRIKVPQLEDVQAVLDVLAEIPDVEKLRSIIVLATNFRRGDVERASAASIRAAALGNGELD